MAVRIRLDLLAWSAILALTMTRQNPQRATGGIVAALILIAVLFGGCKDDPLDDASPPKSSSTPHAAATTRTGSLHLSGFRDGPKWRLVVFFPKTTAEAAPTSLKVSAADGRLVGSIQAPQGKDLTESPYSFLIEDSAPPVTLRWTRRDGTQGQKVWRIPQ